MATNIDFSIDEETFIQAAKQARELGLSSASLFIKYVYLAMVAEGKLPSKEEIQRAHARQQEKKEGAQWQKSRQKAKWKPIG